MVASLIAFFAGPADLAHRGAAKLAAPDDERVIEEAALLEIFDERGGGLIVIAGSCFFSFLSLNGGPNWRG